MLDPNQALMTIVPPNTAEMIMIRREANVGLLLRCSREGSWLDIVWARHMHKEHFVAQAVKKLQKLYGDAAFEVVESLEFGLDQAR
mmetsp:Transcript_30476/g.71583  ORF Transcript_30476/g.71583 Transcript_30476/m.71583 type:complete len:86 (+) Transcript_30476:207-464(+)